MRAYFERYSNIENEQSYKFYADNFVASLKAVYIMGLILPISLVILFSVTGTLANTYFDPDVKIREDNLMVWWMVMWGATYLSMFVLALFAYDIRSAMKNDTTPYPNIFAIVGWLGLALAILSVPVMALPWASVTGQIIMASIMLGIIMWHGSLHIVKKWVWEYTREECLQWANSAPETITKSQIRYMADKFKLENNTWNRVWTKE